MKQKLLIRLSLGGIRTMPLDRRALVGVLSLFAGLCVYRAYHLYTTSFFVSDEYRYVTDAMSGQFVDLNISPRFFFTAFNALIFAIFKIQNVDQFVILLPFYLFFWGAVTLASFYKLLRLLEFKPRSTAIALFSTLFLVSFTLLALGFLSEAVSLPLATLGVYSLAWYAKKGTLSVKSYRSYLALLFGALSFAAASFTRNPYDLFLFGGILAVIVVVWAKKRHELDVNSKHGLVICIIPILVFSIPSAIFLEYPFDFWGSQVNPLIVQPVLGSAAVQSILSYPFSKPSAQAQGTTSGTQSTVSSNPLPSGSSTTSPPTSTQTISSTSTTSPPTSTQTISSTSTTSPPTSTQTISSTSTTSPPTSTQSVRPPSALSVISETLKLFVFGLALGWGPLLFVFGAAGTIWIFLLALKRAQPIYLMLALLCLLSLGTFFLISYISVTGIFSGSDPTAFVHYSTIIRFTDTAIPAYFLAAPFALAVLASRKGYAYTFLVALLIFGAFATQVYPTYASTNLGFSANPFSLSFRSGGAHIRDYVLSHSNAAPFYIVGFSQKAWVLTTGTTQVSNGTVFFFPNLTSEEFISHHWTTFYVYGYDLNYIRSTAPFLVPLVYPGSPPLPTQSGLPITVTSRQVIFNQSIYDRPAYLVQFQIRWND